MVYFAMGRSHHAFMGQYWSADTKASTQEGQRSSSYAGRVMNDLEFFSHGASV
jgi:hypothetical protein